MMAKHGWVTMESAGILATIFGGLIIALAGSMVWAYSTFATQRDVEHRDLTVAGQISDLKETIKLIDQRTYEMNGREGPPPRK